MRIFIVFARLNAVHGMPQIAVPMVEADEVFVGGVNRGGPHFSKALYKGLPPQGFPVGNTYTHSCHCGRS
jgi:hypothetical protein